MNTNMDTIMKIVHEIKNSDQENKQAYFSKKYSDFAKQCPKLFEAACDDQFPMTYLDLMCKQIGMLDEKKTNVDEANNVIFTTLNEKYIDHLTA